MATATHSVELRQPPQKVFAYGPSGRVGSSPCECSPLAHYTKSARGQPSVLKNALEIIQAR